LVGGPSKEELLISSLQTKAAGKLLDPASAQFRNIKVSPDKKAICGDINAKIDTGVMLVSSHLYQL